MIIQYSCFRPLLVKKKTILHSFALDGLKKADLAQTLPEEKSIDCVEYLIK